MVSCSGSLVQSCCGERGGLQTNVTGVCGEHPQCSGHTGFVPTHGCVLSQLHCSGSRLLYMERALRCVRFQFSGPLQKRGLGWAYVLCLPRLSSSGHQEPDRCTLPGAVRLLPPWSQPQSPRTLVWLVRLMSLLGSWPLAATLLADVSHPESQEVFG